MDFHGDFYCFLIFVDSLSFFKNVRSLKGIFLHLIKSYFLLPCRQGLLLPRACMSSSGGLILKSVNGHLHHLVIWSQKLDNGNFYIWIYSSMTKCLTFYNGQLH